MIKLIFNKTGNYMSLVKVSHTVFSMPFALIGFFMGVHEPGYSFSFFKLFLVLLAVFFARNAAMAFNRYADRYFDALNPRTAMREIPSSIIRPGSALKFVVLNSLLFVITAWFINDLCFYLSPLALMIITGYSLTKRFTALCHIILGAGLALAPIGAYLAVTSTFALAPLMLSFAVLFWVAGFDIIYALQDDSFDKNFKLKSIPAFLGRRRSLFLSSFLHLISVVFVVSAGYIAAQTFGLIYWVGAAVFAGMLIYQHTIVSVNNLSRVNLAFFTTNGIASLVFAIIVISGMYL